VVHGETPGGVGADGCRLAGENGNGIGWLGHSKRWLEEETAHEVGDSAVLETGGSRASAQPRWGTKSGVFEW
jgi:hypothetical protein